MPAKPLGRRRGTKRRVSANEPFRNLMLMLLGIAACLTIGIILAATFFFNGDADTDTSLRHKVQALPHLLRGPNAGIAVPSIESQRRDAGHDDHGVLHDTGAHGDKSDALLLALEQKNQRHDPLTKNAPHHDHQQHLKSYPYALEPVAEDYDIGEEFVARGGSRFLEYVDGTPGPYEITETLRQQSDQVARSRRFHVQKAMRFVWGNYVKYAFGKDELKPQSASGSDQWGGQGITLVDSLDTLWLMNLKDEFWQARDWVRDHLDHSTVGSVSVFETTIRDLGGLLAACDWSKDRVFLDKAVDLGDRLLRAFDGATTGIPWGEVNLASGNRKNIGWSGDNAIVAEFGTVQIENRYLSKLTADDKYAKKTERVYEILDEISYPDGLYPYYLRNDPRNKGKFLRDGVTIRPEFSNDKLTFGAMADSLYEYFLKTWLQGGRKEPLYRAMYDKSIQGMHDQLLQTSTPSKLTYIADKNRNSGTRDHKMDHLVCFMGGLLALGAYTDPLGLDSTRAQRDLQTAKALTYTCYQMYARMNTGISAEYVQFYAGRDFQIGRGAPHYLLRPEAVESFFILHQLTGDPVYREWGWEVFQAIEKYCKTPYGYGALNNVADVNGKPRDSMESFFLAETLKYLYLLQDPDTEVDVLHKHVFNTEAHPLRIFPVIDQESTEQ
jgi:mannosyl-oligosaccharide alpha-1,2-mannosidase